MLDDTVPGILIVLCCPFFWCLCLAECCTEVQSHVIHEMANRKYFQYADISSAAVVSNRYLCSFLHRFCVLSCSQTRICNQGEQRTRARFSIATC
uniref:Secreted protein n=1 Tax=Rhipicephalus appendiculatus TaxID=34631 RepID=A0A131YDU9_RHIAP